MTIEDKQTLGDSMADMFAHGNEPLPTTVENPLEPIGTEAAPAAPVTDRTRDEQGRFASPEAGKPDATPQTPASPAVTTDADPEKQPVSKAEFKGMLDERDKRQKAEARLAELEKQMQQQQPQIPTDLDPEQINQHIQSARTHAVFTFSERVARKQFGDDVVQSAMDWGLQRAQQNPAFQAEYLRQDDPIDWAVKQHKRDKILNQLGEDPDAFIEQRVAARLAALNLGSAASPQTEAPLAAASPQPASQPAPQAPAPTRSIANATSAGGLQVVPPQGEFAALDVVHKT